jgi:hypothetical protein
MAFTAEKAFYYAQSFGIFTIQASSDPIRVQD